MQKVVGIVLLMFLFIFSLLAHAEERCMTRKEANDALHNTFKERLVAKNIADNGDIIELWHTSSGSGWTFLAEKTSDFSKHNVCSIAYGWNWKYFQKEYRVMNNGQSLVGIGDNIYRGFKTGTTQLWEREDGSWFLLFRDNSGRAIFLARGNTKWELPLIPTNNTVK